MPIRYSALIEEEVIKKIGLKKSEISSTVYQPDKKQEIVSKGTKERALVLYTKSVDVNLERYVLLVIGQDEKKGFLVCFALKVPFYVHEDAETASPEDLLKAFGAQFGMDTKIGEVTQKMSRIGLSMAPKHRRTAPALAQMNKSRITTGSLESVTRRPRPFSGQGLRPRLQVNRTFHGQRQ